MYDIIIVSMLHAAVMRRGLFHKEHYIMVFSPVTFCEINLEVLR